MTEKFQVKTTAVRYEVTNYPAGGVNAREFTLWVERRDMGRWCVTDGVFCYSKTGCKAYEMNPSSRTRRFKNAYRFSLEDALVVAQQLVPKLRIGKGPNRPGLTAEECWAWESDKREARK